MNWTKTDTGYAAGAYMLERTPGRRWVLLFRDEQIGSQYGTLALAKIAAADHAAAQPPEVGQADPTVSTNGVDVPVSLGTTPAEPPAPAPDVPPTPRPAAPAPFPRDLGDEPLAQTLERLDVIKSTLPLGRIGRRIYNRPRVAA